MGKFGYSYIYSETPYMDITRVVGVIYEIKGTFQKGAHLIVSFCMYFRSYCYFLEPSRIIFERSWCVGLNGVSTGKQFPAFRRPVLPALTIIFMQ
jgi:hypothetical protein